MNFEDLMSALRFVQKKCKCQDCKKTYSKKEIFFLAATYEEVVFELKCSRCGLSALVSVVNTLKSEKSGLINHGVVTKNDVLDIKNFLNEFDGNFKKLFS